jgi:hypothetical protein
VSTFGLDRLLRNRRGNISMMYALVAPILVFAGGAAIAALRCRRCCSKEPAPGRLRSMARPNRAASRV